MNRIHAIGTISFFLGAATLFPAAAVSGPVKTVPWNGHQGAVTFTFDDGRVNQLDNLMPELDRRGIKATFFLNQGSLQPPYSDRWKAVARNGHEIANHTSTHTTPNDSGLDSAGREALVSGFAAALRNWDPDVKAATFAYPYCVNDARSQRFVDRSSFLARACDPGFVMRSDKEPNWMRMPALFMDLGNMGKVPAYLDSALKDSAWFVMLNHGISSTGSDIPTAMMIGFFDRALASHLWISTYAEIGAYWRASFSFDKATVAVGDKGWELAWTSPHPKLPASIPLRVKLDKAFFGAAVTVSQGGAPIAMQADGSYLIEFMKLRLSVAKGNTAAIGIAASSGSARLPESEGALGHAFRIHGLAPGRYSLALAKLNGARLETHGFTVADRNETLSIPLRAAFGNGLYLVRVQGPHGFGRVYRFLPEDNGGQR